MLRWFNTYLIPALNQQVRAETNHQSIDTPVSSLTALDAAKFHRTDTVLQCLRSHDIMASLIPGGCTGLIQPLDVSINRPFKDYLRDVLDLEMDRLGQSALDHFDINPENESAIGERRVIMTWAVGEAW